MSSIIYMYIVQWNLSNHDLRIHVPLYHYQGHFVSDPNTAVTVHVLFDLRIPPLLGTVLRSQ